MKCDMIPQGKEIKALPAVITVLGGDARLCATAARLAETVCTVQMFATGEEFVASAPKKKRPLCLCRSLWEAWAGSRVMVLPLPVTRDGETVWCPLAPDCEIPLGELVRAVVHAAASGAEPPAIFGGQIPPAWREALEAAGGAVYDYLDREDVRVRNAHITAEGAVMTAMEMTDITVQGAPVAVMGYGRIGQLLTRMLLALGARVTVMARRAESRAWAVADGAMAANMPELSHVVGDRTVIFNTAPTPLLTAEMLDGMGKGTVIVDLASPPGGLSPEAERLATARGWPRVVHALSLPGRYAPVTAGQIIADSLLETLALHHPAAVPAAGRAHGADQPPGEDRAYDEGQTADNSQVLADGRAAGAVPTSGAAPMAGAIQATGSVNGREGDT